MYHCGKRVLSDNSQEEQPSYEAAEEVSCHWRNEGTLIQAELNEKQPHINNPDRIPQSAAWPSCTHTGQTTPLLRTEAWISEVLSNTKLVLLVSRAQGDSGTSLGRKRCTGAQYSVEMTQDTVPINTQGRPHFTVKHYIRLWGECEPGIHRN